MKILNELLDLILYMVAVLFVSMVGTATLIAVITLIWSLLVEQP